mgnify:CR=1 FL=1
MFRNPKGICQPPYTNVTIDDDLLVLSLKLTDNYREFNAFDGDGVLHERMVWPVSDAKIGFTEYSLDTYPPHIGNIHFYV